MPSGVQNWGQFTSIGQWLRAAVPARVLQTSRIRITREHVRNTEPGPRLRSTESELVFSPDLHVIQMHIQFRSALIYISGSSLFNTGIPAPLVKNTDYWVPANLLYRPARRKTWEVIFWRDSSIKEIQEPVVFLRKDGISQLLPRTAWRECLASLSLNIQQSLTEHWPRDKRL